MAASQKRDDEHPDCFFITFRRYLSNWLLSLLSYLWSMEASHRSQTSTFTGFSHSVSLTDALSRQMETMSRLPFPFYLSLQSSKHLSCIGFLLSLSVILDMSLQLSAESLSGGTSVSPRTSSPSFFHIRRPTMTSLLSALPNIPSLRKQQLYLEL